MAASSLFNSIRNTLFGSEKSNDSSSSETQSKMRSDSGSCQDSYVRSWLEDYQKISETRALTEDEQYMQTVLQQCEEGSPYYYRLAAQCYFEGIHVPKNPELGFHYMLQAADRNDPLAQHNVAMAYYNGIGVSKNLDMFERYMKKSYKNKYWHAGYFLGLYYMGQNSEAYAMDFFRMAAKQGHAASQYYLGQLYIQFWARAGAEENFKNGMFWLECAYLHGDNDSEFSNKACDAINNHIANGLPKEVILRDIQKIKSKYPQYLENPN